MSMCCSLEWCNEKTKFDQELIKDAPIILSVNYLESNGSKKECGKIEVDRTWLIR